MTDWQKGLKAFREGRIREAADRLQAAAAENEMTVSQAVRFETCAYLGAALYTLGDMKEAAAAFENAFRLSLTPVPPDSLILNLVHAYLAAGRREAAHEALLFLLHHSPGHVGARMLLQRLDNIPAEEPVSGSILGDSTETIKQYLRTLSFNVVESGGYDPLEVREALLQIAGYIDALDRRIQNDQEKISLYWSEIERYREMEEEMVQNMVQMQHEAQTHPAEAASEVESGQLSPIEILFHKKP